jgi:gallate decarboxylase subunit D
VRVSDVYVTREFTAGSGRYRLKCTTVQTGDGVQVYIGGGDRFHIGTVVLCQPRLSLKGDGSISCTASVLNLPGHKDDGIAVPIAEGLCKGLNQVVVVTAGVHIDHAGEAEIGLMLELGREMLGRILSGLK